MDKTNTANRYPYQVRRQGVLLNEGWISADSMEDAFKRVCSSLKLERVTKDGFKFWAKRYNGELKTVSVGIFGAINQ